MSAAAPYVYVIVGATGSGKSSAIRIATGSERRALYWDPMREFADRGMWVTLEGVKRSLIHVAGGPIALVYQPGAARRAEFNKLCELAFKARDLCLIVDEAHEVTSPYRHELLPWWSTLMREGRHRSMRVVLATHRPADLDKALWNFATRLRTGRLNYGSDQRELADVLNVERAELQALLNREWVERDMLTGAISRGSIEWHRGQPVNVCRAEPGPARPAEPVKKKPAARSRSQ